MADSITPAWLERCEFRHYDELDEYARSFPDGRITIRFGFGEESREVIEAFVSPHAGYSGLLPLDPLSRPRLRALWFALTSTQLETGTPLDSDSPAAEETAFLRAIADDPLDPDLQGVYADWLEDRGDPRAETVRLTADRVRRCTETEIVAAPVRCADCGESDPDAGYIRDGGPILCLRCYSEMEEYTDVSFERLGLP